MNELTADKKYLIRTALDNEIVRLLKFHKEWTPWIDANYEMYCRMDGYFTKEQFEKLAKVKIKRTA